MIRLWLLEAYGSPRAGMARQIGAGLREPAIFAQLCLALGIHFAASLPGAIESARRQGIEVAGAVSAHLFGYLLVAPLLLYGLGALIHLVARIFGGKGGFIGARAALFRSLALAAPLVALVALARLSFADLPSYPTLGYLVLAAWFWLFGSCLAEAEGFRSTGRVIAALVIAFVAIALSLIFGVPSPSKAAETRVDHARPGSFDDRTVA